MAKEKFDPSIPEYKKVADLPKEKQRRFIDVPEEEGGGFVGRESANIILETKIEEIVKKDPKALERKINQLCEEAIGMGKDRDKLLKLLEQDKWALSRALLELRSDKGVVLKALERNGLALARASPELRSDREVVLKALEQNGRALLSASPELRSDMQFLLEVAKVNPKALAYTPDNIRQKLGIE